MNRSQGSRRVQKTSMSGRLDATASVTVVPGPKRRDSPLRATPMPIRVCARLPTRYRRLLHFMWFIIWMAGEGALVASLLGWEPLPAPPRPVLIAFLAAFTVAGIYVFYRLLWYMAGRETFTVTRDKLTVRRTIWGV